MNKIKPILHFAISFCVCVSANAQTTWNADIAPIMYENCTSCHHDGAIAPFSLMTYNDALDHTTDIKNSVLDGIMPPWNADENYMHFTGERVLSEEEINAIVAWANDGYEEGTGSAPPLPEYSTESQLDTIDMTIVFPVYTISKNVDEYRRFVIHSDFTENQYMQTFELLMDDQSIIHHLSFYFDTTDNSWNSDLMDTMPGFDANAMTEDNTVMIGGWVPGGYLGQLPPGMAVEIPAGADLVIELHYAPGNLGNEVQPFINLQWSRYTSPRLVISDKILKYSPDCLVEPELFIPANTVQTFHEIFEGSWGSDVSLIGVMPHMHYLGQTFTIYGKPAGIDSIPLISIDHWDFHWQNNYIFQKLKHIENGTPIYGVATFDNTEANEDNPNSPPIDVHAGIHTTDEMMVGWFTYTSYLPGDEDIVIDSTILDPVSILSIEPSGLNIFPNPVDDELQIAVHHFTENNFTLMIFDLMGRVILTKEIDGDQISGINVSALPSGMYMIEITDGIKRSATRFVKL
ncbi:MAG: T9SS type A sorting domain-containing protein [Chitinophagales bacterium]